MSIAPDLDKRQSQDPPEIPRMFGETDVALIKEIAGLLPKQAQIVEVGPWLGGMTAELAEFGSVTVIDHFVWSENNAANYPGIAEAEASFRNAFEENMARAGVSATIIEATLPDLKWSGEKIDFLLIDAPRTAEELHGCLAALATSTKQGSFVLVKHALNLRDCELGGYCDALLGAQMLELVATEQPAWCNIAVFRATAALPELAKVSDLEEFIANAPMSEAPTDPWYGSTLSAMRLALVARSLNWSAAFRLLDQIPTNSEFLALWDKVEVLCTPPKGDVDPNVALLSELVWIKNDQRLSANPPVAFDSAFASRIRAYWLNNADQDWRIDALNADLLADETNALRLEEWAELAPRLFGANVIEIGSNLGVGALGSVLAGAETYNGVELNELNYLAERFSEVFPIVSFTQDDATMLETLDKAQIIVVSSDPEPGGALADQLDKIAKKSKSSGKIVRL